MRMLRPPRCRYVPSNRLGSVALCELSGTSFDLTAGARRLPLVPRAGKLLAGAAASDPRLSGSLALAGTQDRASWSGGLDGDLLIGPPDSRRPVAVHAVLRDGCVFLNDAEMTWGSGRCIGRARLPLDANSLLEGSLELNNVDLREISGLVVGHP